MGLCSKRFGYESPAVGAWTFAVGLQLALGVLLILLGYNGEATVPVLEAEEAMTDRYSAMQYFGIAHLLVSVCTGVVVALGLFVSSCFLLPLCIISIVQSLLLVATAIFCGVLMHPYHAVLKELMAGASFYDLKYNKAHFQLASTFGGEILAAASLSLAALAAYGRAGNMKNDTPIVEAQIYIPCGALLVASATIAAIGGGGEKQAIWMAVLLYGGALLMALLVNVASCCCTPKVFNVVVGAGFACIAIVSVIVCGMAASVYKSVITEYNYFNFNSSFTNLPDTPYPSRLAFFVYMGQGSWLLALASTSLASCILAIFAALYSARSVLFCFGKGDTA